MRRLFLVVAAVAIAVAIAAWAPWASSAPSGTRSAYEPVLDPADFTTTIDNPYFPLPVGRTLVYRGVKDGGRGGSSASRARAHARAIQRA
jgi:hypothetical protein